MSTKQKKKISMVLCKSTKSTHVYSSEDEKDNDFTPTLYIKKTGLPDNPPENLTVEISFTK